MLTTDLGACEWFVWDLRRSNLIDRGQLDQIVGEFLSKNPGAEPPLLAEFLVRQGILTEFQSERLLQGKTQGFVLGPFTLMDSLGAGSMGTVYKAMSKTDSKWYAVKVLPRRSMWNVRIARRKVRLFEQCQHASVVPFVDVGTAGGMHYLAWPLVEGKTLDKIVEENGGKLTPEQAAQFVLQTAEGLDAAHQVSLFHGLLKPSNLMVNGDGLVRILDFGIGCLLAETEGESLVDTMSTANSVNSGLDCASPESIMDPTNLSALGDQYSLGCVLYFCLTGRYPFPDGTAVEKMMAHQHKQPAPIQQFSPEVPAELIAIVDRLMQKNPQQRYPTCADVIDALRPIAQGGAQVPQRRPTMQMPRVRPQKAAFEPAAAPSAPPTVAPELSRPARVVQPAQPAQPVAPPKPAPPQPPRVPAVAPSQVPAAAVPAAREPAPARLPRPGDLPRKAEAAPAPTAPPAVAKQQVRVAAPDEPARQSKFGMVAAVLIAVVAGVAAFFLSSLIKF